MSEEIVYSSLSPQFGIEIEAGATRALLESPGLLHSLLGSHRLLLLRNVPYQLGVQLRVFSRLGQLVARPAASSRWLKSLPDLRIESSNPHPQTGRTQTDSYSHYWHSDLSWAQRPADYTLLFALDVREQSEPTDIADTLGAYANLTADYQQRISAWRAYHHVERSRALRHPPLQAQDSRKQHSPSRDGWSDRGRAFKLWAARRYRSTAPCSGGPCGSLHAVVQSDPGSGRPYVYLGDHAWSLEGFDEKQGMAEIDELNRNITRGEHVYTHQWRQGDLLIINNRSLLHRRVPTPAARGWRTLRRALVWRDERRLTLNG